MDHGSRGGDSSDVSDQEEHSAHGSELVLPEPDGQDLHDRDVDDGGTDTDDELSGDHQVEVADLCGHGAQDGTNGDEEHEDRGTHPGSPLVSEDTAGDLHQRIGVEVGGGEKRDRRSADSEEVLQLCGDRTSGSSVEVDEEIGDRQDDEDHPPVRQHLLLLFRIDGHVNPPRMR